MTERCAVKIKDHYAAARKEDRAGIRGDAESGMGGGGDGAASDAGKSAAAEGQGREGLRVLVDQGGCSGFEYKLSFDKEKVSLLLLALS